MNHVRQRVCSYVDISVPPDTQWQELISFVSSPKVISMVGDGRDECDEHDDNGDHIADNDDHDNSDN